MRVWAALALAGGLAACSEPEADAPPADLALNCARDFETQVRAIEALPGFTQAPAPGEPYRYLNRTPSGLSFVLTLPDAPAHPAIVRQEATAQGLQTTGCAFGDEAAFEALLAYVKGLSVARGRTMSRFGAGPRISYMTATPPLPDPIA